MFLFDKLYSIFVLVLGCYYFLNDSEHLGVLLFILSELIDLRIKNGK